MSKTEKTFDAVAMMRSARDKLSAKIEGLTLEEELKWLSSQEVADPFLKRLRESCCPISRGSGPVCGRPLIGSTLGEEVVIATVYIKAGFVTSEYA